MHPNKAFRADDEDAMRRFVAGVGFAHLFAATPDGPMVVHAPLTPAGANFRFHVARGNRITRWLDGAAVAASIAGPQGYISPSWYVEPGDQVPTWNYVAVELDGVARRLEEDALVEQLDLLAALHEPRVAPDRPWTRAKMDDAFFRRLLDAIKGFELEVHAIRGTTKLSQNKPEPDRAGVIAGLARSGNVALAEAMRG